MLQSLRDPPHPCVCVEFISLTSRAGHSLGPNAELGYLKDWQFAEAHPVGRTLYRVPGCLGPDWLNAYCDAPGVPWSSPPSPLSMGSRGAPGDHMVPRPVTDLVERGRGLGAALTCAMPPF